MNKSKERVFMVRKFLFAALFALPITVLAGSSELPLRPNAPFQAQQVKVRSDLMGGEAYSEIAAADRDRVIAALDRMSLIIGNGTLEALSPDQQVQVFNDQEFVNNVLTKARSDSRLVCRRQKTIGSHMPATQCLTVAERERMRRNVQNQVGPLRTGKNTEFSN
ncbi:hypothetical protein [Stenotrophomonas sp. SY1]|uniref:hypothetical protein n=1 Tax=Stenotrophomonas sp. SY1 TaxID=477235 RepID=UPI001E42EA95|nr:hypothetical protein [Stenotrophomonas sp. SY1]MCD9086149.1 hypothetical protein [Stenotrophomonas sp. SY1]